MEDMGKKDKTEETKVQETQEYTFDEHWDDFTLRESAIDIIAKILGFNYRDLTDEKKKSVPDLEKIKELETERIKLRAERKRIYFGDKELMKYVRDNYNPILRKRYGLDKGE